MTVAATDYTEAIAHLPAGASLNFADVPWEDYEQLLADLGPSYSVRIFYDNGRMEIMAPTSMHERPIPIIATLLAAIRDELDIDIESFGSTTYRLQWKAKGAEPDDSFYIQNAALVIGKEEDISLDRDPPPDIVVEADRTNSSLNKFPIYAGLGVPEIWRVKNGNVRFYLLDEDSYNESSTSRAFPFLTAQTLGDFVALAVTEGSRKAARAFRSWVRETHQSSDT